MVEDWEIGALYWNCLKSAKGNEKKTLDQVKNKYFDWMLKRDIYFFHGTTLLNHYVSKNPFIIVGVYCPPEGTQIKQPVVFTFLQKSIFDI